MRPGPVFSVVVAPVLVLATAVSLGAWGSSRMPDTRAFLASALDALPADTRVAGFTDWSAIRSGQDAPQRDLTTRSVLSGVADQMDELYGWSAADLDWESYGRSRAGAVMVARLSDGVSLDGAQSALTTLGYTRHDEVWSLDEQGRARVGTELASTLGHLAVVRGARLIVAADSPQYVRTTLAVIDGQEPSALSVRPLADVARAMAGSDTAVVQAGAFGCRATSLEALGADVRAQAATALGRAGDLATPTFMGRGLTDGSRSQSIRFVAAFDSPAQAVQQARVRAALATGPFIGRSGRIEDSLTLREADVSGSVTTLRFDLDPDRGAYMSGEGPVLFASCPD